MTGLFDKFRDWKKKQQERTLEKDKQAIERAKKSEEMWKSAQKVEEAKLKVAKIRSKIKKAAAKSTSLKYGGIIKVFKGIGEELSKGVGNVGENISKERGKKRKAKAKSDDFLDLGF